MGRRVATTAAEAACRAAWELLSVTPVLLAHQGGWDEILLVLVPIVLFAVLLGVPTAGPTSSRDSATW